MMTLFALIEGGRAIMPYVPVAIETARRIKEALGDAGDITVDIRDISDTTIEINDETRALIAQWRAQHPKET